MESERRPNELYVNATTANEAHDRINLLLDRLQTTVEQRDAWMQQATADATRCQNLRDKVADLREAVKEPYERGRRDAIESQKLKADLVPREELEQVEAQLAECRAKLATVPVADFVLRSTYGYTAERVAALERERDELQAERDAARSAAAKNIDDMARQLDSAHEMNASVSKSYLDEQRHARMQAEALDEVLAFVRHEHCTTNCGTDHVVHDSTSVAGLVQRHVSRVTADLLADRKRAIDNSNQWRAERDEARNDLKRASSGWQGAQDERVKQAFAERDEARAIADGAIERADRIHAEDGELLKEARRLRVEAQQRASYYEQLYLKSRKAWQRIVDVRNGLCGLVGYLDEAGETFDSDINADQEG